LTKKQNEDTKNQPLLYIAQPGLEEVKLNIQQTFVVKANQKALKAEENAAEAESEQVKVVAATESLEDVEEAPVAAIEEGKPHHAEEAENDEKTEVIAAAATGHAIHEETEEGEQEETEQEETESKASSRAWAQKSFKEMNNKEKVLFLIHKPHYIPSVRCRIKTIDNVYIGYVNSYENGLVAVKSPGILGEIKVRLEDIVSIQMIGM
jgi:hypothetical protein